MRKIIIPLATVFSLALVMGVVGCGDTEEKDTGEEVVEDTQADDTSAE